MRANSLRESPSQTAGPYVHIGCVPNFCGIEGVYGADLGRHPLDDRARGEPLTIAGTCYDGVGAPLTDALIEIWQADADGNLPSDDAHFTGWARQAADLETGEWVFQTIRPGPTADGQAPHILIWIAARGINLALQTRMYFPDEDNTGDPVLALCQDRAATLIAMKTDDAAYRFEIHLQGPNETVFFDY